MAGGGADILANEISDSLLQGEEFDLSLPNFSGDAYQLPATTTDGLYAPVVRLKNEDLTTKVVGGTGTFDYFMDAFKAHLKGEFEGGRITGEQYTKAYIALTEGAMANATQFLLGKDQAYWGAVAAQLQARQAEVTLVTARVLLESEKTKLQTLRFEAMSAQASYALNKLRLATESVQFDTAKYQLDQLLPLQKALSQKQIEQATAEIASIGARTAQTTEETKGVVNNNELHPLRKSALEKQIAQQVAETLNVGKQGILLDNEAAMQPLKVDMLNKQILGVVGQNLMLAKQAENLSNEILLAPLKKQTLEKQIAQQTAETLNVGKQGLLLDNEAAMQTQKVDMLAKQILGVVAQTSMTNKQIENLQQEVNLGPQKLALLTKQVANQEAQTAYVGKQSLAIDKELELQPYKKTLMQEQSEAQRAQTMDTRTDGTPVAGTVGQQKLLYGQQIISYKRDAEMKAVKVFTDAWVTMKTIDEGLAPPTAFSNTNLDQVLGTMKANNGL